MPGIISELSMFADDLVVIGGGRLIVADTLAKITAGNEKSVVVETPSVDAFTSLMAAHGLDVDPIDDQLVIHGSTKQHVSTLAFENNIQLLELTETSKSLEDSLLEMTQASAEFASA